MAKDNKIRMPSGQGGLTRYYDEYKSRLEISPMTVVVVCVAIMVIILFLYMFGSAWIG
ncbi:preprotein translocase subunit Sec61beta [Candidatus Woesearchaeota archaeon]|jgi:preprotein translocase subunit Sec61beta|nr:preprotein translocase subunit Sec61beta [Candidatus Woesearchaeota archaeon]MBT5739660.1 preprotein translocase subunit Sec61beta [Candidatus Woesearchaeota archaeon]